MNKKKIINDPVYGFINIPHEFIYDIIEHPYFQRLRRIQQVGLTHYVYPGALHTRFHHALGAMHLMNQAIKVLRGKNVEITEEEALGVTIAILLHDIGHGPFSHALEHKLIHVHHEALSLAFMEELNEEFGGALEMAIAIFKGIYPKKFLHQLVSSQLDMDRMDYLNRDSFYTGVSEGVIGYDRIIKMLNVKKDQLVVEEKGIYSIEKFIIARRIMYWQVYLHKAVICAEHMLIHAMLRLKELVFAGKDLPISDGLKYFFEQERVEYINQEVLQRYAKLDDYDVIMALKNLTESEDKTMSYLSQSIINRRLFKIELKNTKFASDYKKKVRRKIGAKLGIDKTYLEHLVFDGIESNSAYSDNKEEIMILFKNGKMKPYSKAAEFHVETQKITKYFFCYPKIN